MEGGVYSEPAFGLAPAGVDAGGRSDTLWCCAWMAVYEPASGAFGYGRTGSFQLPEVITALVRGAHRLRECFGIGLGAPLCLPLTRAACRRHGARPRR